MAPDGGDRTGLGTGSHGDFDGVLVEDAGNADSGSQRGVDHRHRHGAVQIIAVTDEELVLLLVDLHVEVAGRPAAGADLALSGKPNPHAVADAGRDLHADIAPRPGPAVTAAAVTRVGNDLADPGADGTWTLCTSPRPPQVSQVAGRESAWVPRP